MPGVGEGGDGGGLDKPRCHNKDPCATPETGGKGQGTTFERMT